MGYAIDYEFSWYALFGILLPRLALEVSWETGPAPCPSQHATILLKYPEEAMLSPKYA